MHRYLRRSDLSSLLKDLHLCFDLGLGRLQQVSESSTSLDESGKSALASMATHCYPG